MARRKPDDAAARVELPAGTRRLASTARARIARDPLLDAGFKEIEREAGKLFEEQSLQDNLAAIASRRKTLNHVLLDAARRAEHAVDAALRETERVAQAEARIDARLRRQLIARLGRGKRAADAPRPPRKDDYVVKGRVLHPETEKPVAGILVEATDKDVYRHDALGAVVTDDEGRFEIAFDEDDFQECGEGEPEVVLRVGLERRAMLPVEDLVARPAPGKPADVTLTLPAQHASLVEALAVAPEVTDEQRLDRLRHGQAVRRVQARALEHVGTALREGLEGWVRTLQTRAGEPTGPAPAPATGDAATVPAPIAGAEAGESALGDVARDAAATAAPRKKPVPKKAAGQKAGRKKAAATARKAKKRTRKKRKTDDG